ncbi:MAG: hypothetical protein QW474_00515 [Candidatus Aenigmatarchaeota archaeon]
MPSKEDELSNLFIPTGGYQIQTSPIVGDWLGALFDPFLVAGQALFPTSTFHIRQQKYTPLRIELARQLNLLPEGYSTIDEYISRNLAEKEIKLREKIKDEIIEGKVNYLLKTGVIPSHYSPIEDEIKKIIEGEKKEEQIQQPQQKTEISKEQKEKLKKLLKEFYENPTKYTDIQKSVENLMKFNVFKIKDKEGKKDIPIETLLNEMKKQKIQNTDTTEMNAFPNLVNKLQNKKNIREALTDVLKDEKARTELKKFLLGRGFAKENIEAAISDIPPAYINFETELNQKIEERLQPQKNKLVGEYYRNLHNLLPPLEELLQLAGGLPAQEIKTERKSGGIKIPDIFKVLNEIKETNLDIINTIDKDDKAKQKFLFDNVLKDSEYIRQGLDYIGTASNNKLAKYLTILTPSVPNEEKPKELSKLADDVYNMQLNFDRFINFKNMVTILMNGKIQKYKDISSEEDRRLIATMILGKLSNNTKEIITTKSPKDIKKDQFIQLLANDIINSYLRDIPNPIPELKGLMITRLYNLLKEVIIKDDEDKGALIANLKAALPLISGLKSE